MFYMITEGDIRQSFACKDRSINIRENGDLEIIEVVNKGKDFEAKRTKLASTVPKGNGFLIRSICTVQFFRMNTNKKIRFVVGGYSQLHGKTIFLSQGFHVVDYDNARIFFSRSEAKEYADLYDNKGLLKIYPYLT